MAREWHRIESNRSAARCRRSPAHRRPNRILSNQNECQHGPTGEPGPGTCLSPPHLDHRRRARHAANAARRRGGPIRQAPTPLAGPPGASLRSRSGPPRVVVRDAPGADAVCAPCAVVNRRRRPGVPDSAGRSPPPLRARRPNPPHAPRDDVRIRRRSCQTADSERRQETRSSMRRCTLGRRASETRVVRAVIPTVDRLQRLRCP